MKMKTIAYTLCMLAACLLSCEREEELPVAGGEGDAGKVPVTVSVNLPDFDDMDFHTRAGEDSQIKNIDLLIFDENGKFTERVPVDAARLNATGPAVKFTVPLDASPKPRTIHLVANGRKQDGTTDRLNFGVLTAGATEASAMPLLKTNTPATGADLMPLVMWGRLTLPRITASSKADNVPLLRAAACIQVKSSAVTVKRYTVHNGAATGYLTPAQCTSTPAVPDAARPLAGVLPYDKGWVNGAGPLYIYESNATATDNTMTIIVETNRGYYRLLLRKGETPMNIVRNHRYTVTITSVGMDGCLTAEDAIKAKPSNAVVTEVRDEEKGYYIIWTNGTEYVKSPATWWGMVTDGVIDNVRVPIQKFYVSSKIKPELTTNAPFLTDVEYVQDPKDPHIFTVYAKYSSKNLIPQASSYYDVYFNIGGLSCVSRIEKLTWSKGDTDSRVFDLKSVPFRGSKVGYAEVLDWNESKEFIYLHPTDGNPGSFSGSWKPGFVQEIEAATTFVHVKKMPSGKWGCIEHTYYDGWNHAANVVVFAAQ